MRQVQLSQSSEVWHPIAHSVRPPHHAKRAPEAEPPQRRDPNHQPTPRLKSGLEEKAGVSEFDCQKSRPSEGGVCSTVQTSQQQQKQPRAGIARPRKDGIPVGHTEPPALTRQVPAVARESNVDIRQEKGSRLCLYTFFWIDAGTTNGMTCHDSAGSNSQEIPTFRQNRR